MLAFFHVLVFETVLFGLFVCRRMIVNSGRMVVDLIACIDNSYVLSAGYG